MFLKNMDIAEYLLRNAGVIVINRRNKLYDTGINSYFIMIKFENETKHEFMLQCIHLDDVKRTLTWWRHFPRCWPFLRGINRSLVDSPHKGQWRGALMFYLICAWTNAWTNNLDAGYLRRHRAHYDVTIINYASNCCKPVIRYE